jgi:hypothetical protein
MAGFFLPLGLLNAGRIFRVWRRKLEADEEGVCAPNGGKISYMNIKHIDKSKWDRKSIAFIQYAMNGKKRRIKLDGWIYNGIDDILNKIEKKVESRAQ